MSKSSAKVLKKISLYGNDHVYFFILWFNSIFFQEVQNVILVEIFKLVLHIACIQGMLSNSCWGVFEKKKTINFYL